MADHEDCQCAWTTSGLSMEPGCPIHGVNRPCQHCGNSRPDADGDHTCPCPYSDADCPNHLPPIGMPAAAGEAGQP